MVTKNQLELNEINIANRARERFFSFVILAHSRMSRIIFSPARCFRLQVCAKNFLTLYTLCMHTPIASNLVLVVCQHCPHLSVFIIWPRNPRTTWSGDQPVLVRGSLIWPMELLLCLTV